MDETIVPSKANLIANQSDMDTATAIETSTSDSVTKRPRHDIDMEEPAAETSTLGTSNKTAAVSTRVTRHSKRLKVNADPAEGPMMGDANQAQFVMDLFAMRTRSDGKCSHFLRYSNLSHCLAGNLLESSTSHIAKSSRTTPAIGTSTRSGSVLESSGQSIKEASVSNMSDEDDGNGEDKDD